MAKQKFDWHRYLREKILNSKGPFNTAYLQNGELVIIENGTRLVVEFR